MKKSVLTSTLLSAIGSEHADPHLQGQYMPYILLTIGCIGCILGIIGLSIPQLQQLDTFIVLEMSQHHTGVLNTVAIGLSLLGGLPSTLLIGGIGCWLLALKKRYSDIYFVILSIFSSAAAGWLLKFLINRPRPEAIYQMVSTYGASFPSAHSIYAAVLACSALFLLRKHPRFRQIAIIAGLWIISMGLSRIYLAAHFPSDVLAGWGIGIICTTGLYLIFNRRICNKNTLLLDKNLNEVE